MREWEVGGPRCYENEVLDKGDGGWVREDG